MTTLEAVVNVFFLLCGVLFLAFRDPLTNYLMAMYPASVRPARRHVYWVVVVGGVGAIVVGGLRLLRFL